MSSRSTQPTIRPQLIAAIDQSEFCIHHTNPVSCHQEVLDQPKGETMASATNTLRQPETTVAAAPISTSWAIAILLAINALPMLLLPVLIFLVNGRQFSDRDPLPYLLIGLIAVIQAQLFLLAFWMAFGGWPQRWRSLWVFAITIAFGLYFGLSFAAIFLFSSHAANTPDSWVSAFTIVFMAPIMASGLLWMLAAIFIIPSWCCGYEINLRSDAPRTHHPKRTFSIPQLIIWTAQVALPLGSLNIFLTVTENRAGALQMIAPFLAVCICGTPLAVVLLIPNLPRSLIVASCLWCLLIAAALWAMPTSQYYIPWPMVFVYALTIAANLIALRQLNFCWQARAA